MSKSIGSNVDQISTENRRVRVFISSTFRDMVAERDALMSHAWPELRRFCLARQVELVEVDMRWGITEEQSTRKETLKLCLDEIRACRPYFIGLIGERYGWIPGNDAFTADLKEEQPWIIELNGKSVTELEILHGVLNNPKMAGRSFFYFREPSYSISRGPGFQAENAVASQKQDDLKERIYNAYKAGQIQLRINYTDPAALSELVLEDLKSAIDTQFPKEDTPDSLTQEAISHESFAEIRRHTYIGRDEYFKTLNRHAESNGGPLLLLGESGSGKSALLANWLAYWKQEHTNDFIFQHYIGSTPDSADHWQLMRRLMAEIKKWSDDPEELPTSHDEMTRDFPLWLAKARLKAEQNSVRFILVLDALNQLEDQGNSRLLGWLPPDAFTGQLRLIVSTLPGQTLEVVKKYGWETFFIEKLTEDERRQMIINYLKRFSKKLDTARIDRIITTSATANPLYLKILLDELRITGTHDKLDERLDEYLAEPDVPRLLKNVLNRYRRHYEKDRKNLVKDALSLICSARRGLSETELLQLLKPTGLEQLPQAVWSPLRAAMEELLVDRDSILNFAHNFLRSAVKEAFISGHENQINLRLQLADYFEALPVSARSCDELPWLLQKIESRDRLRTCLLNIDCFLEIFERDENELRNYWVGLGEQTIMGKAYLESFARWSDKNDSMHTKISHAANYIANFLKDTALYEEAETLYRKALSMRETIFGIKHPSVSTTLNNLAELLRITNRLDEAEPLYRRALSIRETSYGKEHPGVALCLNNLALLLKATNRLDEAELLYRRALSIDEKNYGKEHPDVATCLNNLAELLLTTDRKDEAEPLMHRSLSIYENNYGKEHPDVAIALNNLAVLLKATNRLEEAEPLYRRALSIYENSYGNKHPLVARSLVNLAFLLKATNRMDEAESFMRKALIIDEKNYGAEHPDVAAALNNLAELLRDSNRMDEVESLYRKVLRIEEKSHGAEHPRVATALNNLAELLRVTKRLDEAEPLFHRALNIYEKNYGEEHPDIATTLNNLGLLMDDSNRIDEAESLYRKALRIDEKCSRKEHSSVATILNNLAVLLNATNRGNEAEPLMRRALRIRENTFGEKHPDVATSLYNLASLLRETDRVDEAVQLYRRALSIRENIFGAEHPDVGITLNNFAQFLTNINRMDEAEPLMRRALRIYENSFGEEHPDVATCLNNLAVLLKKTNRINEVEPLMRRVVMIFIKFTHNTGHQHPHLQGVVNNYAGLLQYLGCNQEQIMTKLRELDPDMFG